MSLPSAQRQFTNCIGCWAFPEPVWTWAEDFARTCIRNLEMKNDVILTAQNVRLDVVIGLRLFNFDMPEIYNGRAQEGRREENGPKLCGRTVCLKGCSATE